MEGRKSDGKRLRLYEMGWQLTPILRILHGLSWRRCQFEPSRKKHDVTKLDMALQPHSQRAKRVSGLTHMVSYESKTCTVMPDRSRMPDQPTGAKPMEISRSPEPPESHLVTNIRELG